MKKVFVVCDTDQWLSNNSIRTIGVASTLKKAIKMAQNDEDGVLNVISKNGHIVINEFILNEADCSKVFSTENDDDKDKLIKLRIKKFLKKLGTRVRGNESSAFVDLMMDDHKCIEFENEQYYIPENNSFFTIEDEELLDFLIQNYEVQ